MGAEGLPRVSAGLLRSRAEQTLRAAPIPAALLGAVAASAVLLTPALLAAMPLALIVGIFVLISRAMAARPIIERGDLAVRDGAIVLGGRKLCARDAVTSGAVVPREVEGTLVRLERKSGVPIDLVVADAESGRDVLASLGLDPAHAVARFHLLASDVATFRRRITLVIVGILATLAAALVGAMANAPLLIPLVLLPTLLGALTLLVPSKVTVGTDGITIRRLGREEFLSLDGVVEAIAADGEPVMGSEVSVVRLLDASGGTVHELLVDQKKDGPFADGLLQAIDARARSLAERINEVIGLRASSSAPFDRATLARGDQEALDWVRSLRGLLVRAASFRDAGPPTEDALLAIVEDGSAHAEDRAAAAAALSRARPELRERIRVAAEATAAPKLRIALDAALDEDDEKLAEALRGLGG